MATATGAAGDNAVGGGTAAQVTPATSPCPPPDPLSPPLSSPPLSPSPCPPMSPGSDGVGGQQRAAAALGQPSRLPLSGRGCERPQRGGGGAQHGRAAAGNSNLESVVNWLEHESDPDIAQGYTDITIA